MFGDMAATDSSMAMAMTIYPLQGHGLAAATTTTTTTSSSSYNPHHQQHILSFMGHSPSSPDPTLMPRPPTPAATSNATLLLPPPPPNPSSLPCAPKYKFVTCSPADWTTHELAILEEGLLRYAHESNITKYIKVAAMLPTKTIRDVALRCCWDTGKESGRRKQDEYYSGKNVTYLKNKMAASTPIVNVPMPPRNNAFPFSVSLHHPSQNTLVSMKVPVLDIATQHLLDENNQLLSQIAANIDTLKMEENLDLFLRTNNNIRAISERMREAHGIMDQMPPLPIDVNEGHLSSLAHFLRGARLT